MARLVGGWFAADGDGSREFGGFYGDHPRWWSLVDGEQRRGYIALLGEEPAGFVDLELGDPASFAIYIRPEWRGRHLGTAIARAAVCVARSAGARALELGVRTDNARSLAACRSAGFVDTGIRGAYVMLHLRLNH